MYWLHIRAFIFTRTCANAIEIPGHSHVWAHQYGSIYVLCANVNDKLGLVFPPLFFILTFVWHNVRYVLECAHVDRRKPARGGCLGLFLTGVWRKHKLGSTKQKSVPGISSLGRVYISSSTPQSERTQPPGGGFIRSMCSLEFACMINVHVPAYFRLCSSELACLHDEHCSFVCVCVVGARARAGLGVFVLRVTVFSRICICMVNE